MGLSAPAAVCERNLGHPDEEPISDNVETKLSVSSSPSSVVTYGEVES